MTAPVITTRPISPCPGWPEADIKARLLALAGNDTDRALDLACRDLEDLLRGGMYRPTSFVESPNER